MDVRQIARTFNLVIRRNSNVFGDPMFEVTAAPAEQTVLGPTETVTWSGDAQQTRAMLEIIGVPRKQAALALLPDGTVRDAVCECYQSANDLARVGFRIEATGFVL